MIFEAKQIGFELEIIENCDNTLFIPTIENLDAILVESLTFEDYKKIIQSVQQSVTIVSISNFLLDSDNYGNHLFDFCGALSHNHHPFNHHPFWFFYYHHKNCKCSDFFNFNQKRGEIYNDELERALGKCCCNFHNYYKYFNSYYGQNLMTSIIDHPLIDGCNGLYERLFFLDSLHKLLMQWMFAEWGNFIIYMNFPCLFIRLLRENQNLNSVKNYCRVLLNSIRLKKN